MSAYVIGHIAVIDAQKWAQYRSQVPATLTPWGGEVMMRGHRAAVLSGHHAYTDMVVLRFPNVDAVEGWYASPAYQALVPLREQGADVVLVSYES